MVFPQALESWKLQTGLVVGDMKDNEEAFPFALKEASSLPCSSLYPRSSGPFLFQYTFIFFKSQDPKSNLKKFYKAQEHKAHIH